MTDMTLTLDELPAEQDPVHLLLIGDSKTGKSTYVAQAAKAGFRVIYVDSDNGASALRHALKDDPEAMKRVHYIRTTKPTTLLIGILKSTVTQPYRWNKTRDMEFSKFGKGLQPDDTILEFRCPLIPTTIVMATDSWTSAAGDAMGLGASANSVDILEMGNQMQQVYGDANNRLTLIANLIQKSHFHQITIAHGTYFERYEKPVGKGTPKQSEMILKETIQVPVSSSRPHGHSMASRWNHIGWLVLNRMGEVELDFTRAYDRVGGGPPNRKAKLSELPFARLVDPINGVVPEDPGPPTGDDAWLIIRKAEELLVESASPTKTNSASTTAPAKGPAFTGLKSGSLGQLKR